MFQVTNYVLIHGGNMTTDTWNILPKETIILPAAI
jgi:hypothetical protein